eukprot:129892-Hanusia_phi.AAC.2
MFPPAQQLQGDMVGEDAISLTNLQEIPSSGAQPVRRSEEFSVVEKDHEGRERWGIHRQCYPKLPGICQQTRVSGLKLFDSYQCCTSGFSKRNHPINKKKWKIAKGV